ncbi:UNVERIFIED_CONTAM: hypothetical protein FKN15_050002 [Acipenser sinensis]
MDQKENFIDQDITLTVVLPGGVEKSTTVHGSKPMMDLLVVLCGKYRLNPSSHTIELLSTNRNQIKFKPNALIGELEAEKVILKPKGMNEKKKKSAPVVPEATVRLVINYKKTQKTILRVSPQVPLQHLIPAVSEKCEFDPKHIVLLKEERSREALDLTKSLNDLGLRELYALDSGAVCIGRLVLCDSEPLQAASAPASPTLIQKPGMRTSQSVRAHTYSSSTLPSDMPKKRRAPLPPMIVSQSIPQDLSNMQMNTQPASRPEGEKATSAPASPTLIQKPGMRTSQSVRAHTYSSSTLPSDMPKKRRAPLPPMIVSQSIPQDLSNMQMNTQPASRPEGEKDFTGISRQASSESSLRRTKRKAPAPPAPPCKMAQEQPLQETHNKGRVHEVAQEQPLQETHNKAGVFSQHCLEEINEKEEATVSNTEDSGTTMHAQQGVHSPYMSSDLPSDTREIEPTSPADSADRQSSPTMSESCEREKRNGMTTDGKQASVIVNSQALDHSVEEINGHSVTLSLQNNEVGSVTCKSEETCTVTASKQPVKEQQVTASCIAVAADESSKECDTEKTNDFEKIQDPKTNSAVTKSVKMIDTAIQASAEMDSEDPAHEETNEEVQGQSIVKTCFTTSEKKVHASNVTDISLTTQEGWTQDMSIKKLHPTENECIPQNYEKTADCQTKNPVIYKRDSEPKPKPSNEAKRDYIPKIGMTTYKIVPQKSLEKLKFYEVDVTLEVQDKIRNLETLTPLTDSKAEVPQYSDVQSASDSNETLSHNTDGTVQPNEMAAKNDYVVINNEDAISVHNAAQGNDCREKQEENQVELQVQAQSCTSLGNGIPALESDPEEIRNTLLDAILSGDGAAKLKKVKGF